MPIKKKHRRLTKRGKIIFSLLGVVAGLSLYTAISRVTATSEMGSYAVKDGNTLSALESWQQQNEEIHYVLTFHDDDKTRQIPVIETDHPDDYYRHNVYGHSDPMGAPFIDHLMDPVEDQNIVVFAHSSPTEDWNFTFLKKYADEGYFNTHPTFTVESKMGTYEYTILLLEHYDTDNEDEWYDWAEPNYGSVEETTAMFQEAANHAVQIRYGIPYDGQNIMTLVTCDIPSNLSGKNMRYVIQAVRTAALD